VSVQELELGSLANIRAFAERVLAAHPRIDVLINNAGVMACPFAKTADGFELQFGSNHLGHFLATCLLVPALRRGTASRIVSLSSRGHHMSPVVFDDIHFERRPYDKWQSYGQAKTANVLFAVGLERRLAKLGIHAYAVHPGAIVTELGRHLQPEDIQFLQTRSRGMQFQVGRARRRDRGLLGDRAGARGPRRPLPRGLPRRRDQRRARRPRRRQVVRPRCGERRASVELSERAVGTRFDFA